MHTQRTPTHTSQVPDLDAIVGAVSVGGFMAGVCVAAKVLPTN